MVQDWTVAQWMMLGRSLVGRTWSPRRVAVRHEAPGDADAYERWFNAPVAFGAKRVEIVFDAQLLDLPVVGADPTLVRLLDRHIEQVLARLPRAASLVDRVRAEAARSISDGAAPTAASIARALNMSERTLLRRLSEEDATPSDIIADVRRELASQYLRDPAVSITEAAFLLGYSEPSAFHRAFKRWTGVTPAEFRERTAGA
jgi:AraC-like DNA-binding protein